jgi:hypothetical protein
LGAGLTTPHHKKAAVTEPQKTRGKRSIVFYNDLKSSWEKKLYTEVCTQEARRGIGWWKMGIWRLKVVKGNTEQGMCPMCNKE